MSFETTLNDRVQKRGAREEIITATVQNLPPSPPPPSHRSLPLSVRLVLGTALEHRRIHVAGSEVKQLVKEGTKVIKYTPGKLTLKQLLQVSLLTGSGLLRV